MIKYELGNSCFQNHRNCCLLSEHLTFVADKTVSDWRRILTHLGVDDSTIRAVEEDAVLRNITNDSREIAYQGYLKWKNIDPYKASFCSLQDALAKVQRNDVCKNLKEKFNFAVRRSVQRHDSFRIPVTHFVGREKEIDKIDSFCENKQTNQMLLLLYGLPGVGKSELLQQSLNRIIHKHPSLNIIKPLFPATNGVTCWGLEDIAANILEEIQPEQVYIQFRVAALHKLLVSITKPTLLVLELCSLDFRKDSLLMIWNFLTNLMRSNNKFLKIIVTSFKSPDIPLLQNIHVQELHLKGLSQPEAFHLLRSLNPRMTTMNCQRLYERCGSHPFILRKLGAHIKNFHANDKELDSFIKALDGNTKFEMLQPMLSTSAMKYSMNIVFQELEESEQKALVKLSGFPDIIPIDALKHIFDRSLYQTCNHLCSMHCIIEKSGYGQYFKINLLTSAFIKEFAETDKKLREIMMDAKMKITDYYLDFLKSLDHCFQFPNATPQNTHFFELIADYREDCSLCPNDCSCPPMKIVKFLFRDRKTLIMRAIQQGLQIDGLVYKTVEVCVRVVHFLRHVVCQEDLLDLYDKIFVTLDRNNEKVLMAMTMSSIVFIKVYTKVLEGREENIRYFTKAISHLEHKQYFRGGTEILIHCHMKRAHLRSFCKTTCAQGFADLETADQLIQCLTNPYKQHLFSLVLTGYRAAMHYRRKDYHASIKERQKQIEGYRKHFGKHIYTAKALHYQGQAYGKVKVYGSAITCCLVSYEIYRNLQGEGIDTMRVLSTLGKLYIRAGKQEMGFKKLGYAMNVAENALGDHDRVALCYEQLARLKKENGFLSDANELEQRAAAIRKNYEMCSLGVNMKKYSLQVSREIHLIDEFNGGANKNQEQKEHYFEVVCFLMIIAIFWRLFEIYYTCSCDRF